MEKQCSKCKEVKPISEFNKNKARKDGVNTFCRGCHNTHSRAYYSENGERQRVQIKQSRKLQKENRHEKIWELLCNSNCADCENRDPRVLEFDHLPQYKKSKNICDMLRDATPWKVILEEIAKCEVVCANCHKIRTAERLNSYRHQKYTPQELRLAEALPLKETCVGSNPI